MRTLADIILTVIVCLMLTIYCLGGDPDKPVSERRAATLACFVATLVLLSRPWPQSGSPKP